MLSIPWLANARLHVRQHCLNKRFNKQLKFLLLSQKITI